MIYIIDFKSFLEVLTLSYVTFILYKFVISPFIKHLIHTKEMFDNFNEEIKPLISKMEQQK